MQKASESWDDVQDVPLVIKDGLGVFLDKELHKYTSMDLAAKILR